ncbi:cellulose binding domain-containing protein [Microbispora sp. NBRC 16548]|uniref:cellulose binding domain-containing protein n=1 Tax=Microbispora sp. NBRC 16548 TaxID=3030994 RepID=UPI0024A39F56|nr:cellulose binding domain-containing protein [Microbispora sp. NBRC 16548]GLX10924.1 hypothetical protein Misp03_78500 [Microbispora sp. NBRC 16548]
MPGHSSCQGLCHRRFRSRSVRVRRTECRVTYTVTSQWPGGFGANVTIGNLGDPVNG